MSLYEIADAGLAPHEPVALADLGLRERADLQRLLRDDIGVLGDDLLVIGEEFGYWEDARRRIDLLARPTTDLHGRPACADARRRASALQDAVRRRVRHGRPPE